MKKYTDKHLESVEPEFIVGAEKTIVMLRRRDGSANTCPAIILDPSMRSDIIICDGDWCNKLMQYGTDECPCYCLGIEGSLKLFENFVSQWKQWAGIEE